MKSDIKYVEAILSESTEYQRAIKVIAEYQRWDDPNSYIGNQVLFLIDMKITDRL